MAPGGRLEVLAVHTVGVWRWKDIPKDLQCVICENAFELPCAQCDAPGDSCPPAFGSCGHIFHLHCIGAWLHRDGVRSEEQGTCPMCRQLWQYAPQQPANGASSSSSSLGNLMEVQLNAPSSPVADDAMAEEAEQLEMFIRSSALASAALDSQS
ncbi:anaphase-promoting complex subunit 11 [Cyclospora cayetanensis]|uniref:Anaphase-promoting complex subunit 11 n=2 Tax=Cyclospora cayetanensis TaxID=88456 RepID=A0A6P5WET6_9EIME|nr:anaphase-promoting complex subunit 11 [Cyclospora cayetanensis]OEH74706.1 anaphase promoting complex subunit related protein [Cyclospora cayetanensis]